MNILNSNKFGVPLMKVIKSADVETSINCIMSQEWTRWSQDFGDFVDSRGPTTFLSQHYLSHKVPHR